MSDRIPVSLTVDGETHTLEVAPARTLLDVLRLELRLTGVRRGCDQGSCGACMVLVDDRPMFSCLSLAVSMGGRAITTVESLTADGALHPVQEALVEQGAVQCGFCMSGIVIAAKALLDRNPHPTVNQVRRALGSNVCRCTGYVKVVKAIASVGQQSAQEPQQEPQSGEQS